MYPRRIVAMVLALIALSSLGAGWVVAAPHAGASSAPLTVLAAPHPQATNVTVSTTLCDAGFPESQFQVGTGLFGRVCFYVTDPSDSSVLVTVIDQNASRDSVPNPAATFTLNTSAGYNYSYVWNIGYTIPLALPLGGNWTVTASGRLGGTANTTFFVHSYYVDLSADASDTLLGHSANVSYWVEQEVNGAPTHGLTSVEYLATYTSDTGATLWVTGPAAVNLGTASTGTFSLHVPLNASLGSSIYVQVWANVSGARGNLSEWNEVTVGVAALAQPGLQIGDCPGGCVRSNFDAGSLLYLSVFASLRTNAFGSTGNPAAGVTVRLTFQANGTNLTQVSGSPPLTGTTNASGGFAVVFLASVPGFSTSGTDTILVNVSDPVNPQDAAQAEINFTLQPSHPSAWISLTADQAQYYAGDTATITWAIGAVSPTVAAQWQVAYYQVYDGYGDLLFSGTISSNAETGTFAYAIPTSFTGALTVEADMYNQTSSRFAALTLSVIAPTLLLSASEASYHPGDSVTISLTPEGSVFTGATYFGRVTDPQGDLYWLGAINGTSFSFKVPGAAPPASLEVDVSAQSAALGLIASQTTFLNLASGLTLTVSLATLSQYTDGSFRPGQTIQISYALSVMGTTTLPRAFAMEVLPVGTFAGSAGLLEFQTNSASGTVSYTIPSSLSTGSIMLGVYATALGNCVGQAACFAQGYVVVNVNPSPSVLNYEIGAGSGVTVGWVILLVLIILVALFVWFVARRGRRPSRPAPVSVEPALGAPSAGAASATPTSSGDAGTSSPPSAGGHAWDETSNAPSPGSPPLPGSSPGSEPSSGRP